MSANNLSNNGETKIPDSPNFVSPNIIYTAVDEPPKIDEAAEERRRAETVKIDGIPFKENEVQYRAKDIKTKKHEFFTNVKNSRKREREAIKSARIKRINDKKRQKSELAEAKRKARAELRLARQKDKATKKKIASEHNKTKKNDNKRANIISRTKKRKFVLIGIVLIVVFIVSILGYIIIDSIYSKAKLDEQIVAKNIENETLRITLNEVHNEFQTYTNPWEAISLYDTYLDRANNDIQRALIYSARAQAIHEYIIMNEGDNSGIEDRMMKDSVEAAKMFPDTQYSCIVRNYAAELNLNSKYEVYINKCNSVENAPSNDIKTSPSDHADGRG